MWEFPLIPVSYTDTVQLPDIKGGFGYVRTHHVHEGIDIYATHGQSVYAVEAGEVVHVEWFTGAKSTDNSHWWNNTQAVMVEGESGVVLYGEITTDLKVGDQVTARSKIGEIATVLKKDKGRPMSMLHLELHKRGSRSTFEWKVGDPQPALLLDPTEQIEAAFTNTFGTTPDSNRFKGDRKIRYIDMNGHNGMMEGELVDLNTPDKLQPHQINVNRFRGEIKTFDEYDDDPIRRALWVERIQCSECGDKFRPERVNDDTVKLSGKPCKYAGGMKPYVNVISIPSGKAVFANDLRLLAPEPDSMKKYIAGREGSRVLTDFYATNKMAHVCVGNSCPGVYVVDGGLNVGTTSDREEMSQAECGSQVASITTDLWWYSMMDYDVFKKRVNETGFNEDYFEVEVVDVPAGDYSFSDELNAFNDLHAVVYSKIRKL